MLYIPQSVSEKIVRLIHKFGMHCLPLLQLDLEPETIDTECDDSEQEPFDPIAEQLHSVTGELQASSIDYSVLGFPVIHHTAGPGVADANCAYGDNTAKKFPADQL